MASLPFRNALSARWALGLAAHAGLCGVLVATPALAADRSPDALPSERTDSPPLAGASPGSPRGPSTVSAGDAAPSVPARPRWYDPFALDLSAATWVPLSIGPEASLELPGRALLQVHVGWMPELYSQTLTDTVANAGAIDRPTAELVDGAVRGATTWRIAAGWRPLPDAGLEVTVGYAHVSVEGRTNTAEVLPLVPPEVAERLGQELGDTNIQLHSSIHHFTMAAGWRWLIGDRFVIRANLGYLQAFSASSDLAIESRPDLARLAEPTVRSALHEQYMRYIKVPVVGLGIGYRFF